MCMSHHGPPRLLTRRVEKAPQIDRYASEGVPNQPKQIARMTSEERRAEIASWQNEGEAKQ